MADPDGRWRAAILAVTLNPMVGRPDSTLPARLSLKITRHRPVVTAVRPARLSGPVRCPAHALARVLPFNFKAYYDKTWAPPKA